MKEFHVPLDQIDDIPLAMVKDIGIYLEEQAQAMDPKAKKKGQAPAGQKSTRGMTRKQIDARLAELLKSKAEG